MLFPKAFCWQAKPLRSQLWGQPVSRLRLRAHVELAHTLFCSSVLGWVSSVFPWPELLSRPTPSLTTHLPSFWPRRTRLQSLAQAALCLEASSPRSSPDWLLVIWVLLKCRLPTWPFIVICLYVILLCFILRIYHYYIFSCFWMFPLCLSRCKKGPYLFHRLDYEV